MLPKNLPTSVVESVKIQDGKVTVNPSIICPFCNAHFWIKNGEVVA